MKEKSFMHKKFDKLWFGPSQIEKKYRIKSFSLITPGGGKLTLPINGYILKPYCAEET